MAKASAILPVNWEERALFFAPCQTKEALHDWMLAFLGLELPDHTIDPDSNSNPMDLVWEVYSLALRGGSEEVSEILGFAARQSYKTLIAAVLEILMIFHHHRDPVHMAASESQSLRAQKYVRKFLGRRILRDFCVGDNKRTIQVTWYEGEGRQLTESQFTTMPERRRDKYECHAYEIQVVVCTTSGVQGPHGEFMVVDEVDVIANPQNYTDAKMIPSERVDRGQLPITLYISTRKSGVGLVQREIDDAPKTGMQVRHWNIVDVTQACPKERHLPDLPRLPIWVDPKELVALGEAEFSSLAEDKQKPFQRMEGFTGCLENCKMFASCRGLLATQQVSQAATLKSVSATQLAFRKLGGDADTANSQLMSRKPSSEGMIYPRLDADLHLVTRVQFLAKFSEHSGPVTPEEFIRILVDEFGAYWSAGIDWGFTHNFAVPYSLIVKPYQLVMGYIEVAGLETMQRVALCKDRFSTFSPVIWPDPEDPTSIATFKKHGFQMRRWSKKPGSVKAGIDIVRGKLRPLMNEPELLFLSESDEAKLLFDRMKKYHFTKNAQGQWTDIPAEEGDDGPDALRYNVMNEFPVTAGGISVAGPAPEAPELETFVPETNQERERRWFNEMVSNAGGEPMVKPAVVKGKKFAMLMG